MVTREHDVTHGGTGKFGNLKVCPSLPHLPPTVSNVTQQQLRCATILSNASYILSRDWFRVGVGQSTLAAVRTVVGVTFFKFRLGGPNSRPVTAIRWSNVVALTQVTKTYLIDHYGSLL